MTQAKRMTHLVHDDVLHIRLRDFLGFGAIHLHAARFQQVHREVHFMRGLIGVIAGRIILVRGQRVAYRVSIECGGPRQVFGNLTTRTTGEYIGHTDIGIQNFPGAGVFM